VHVCVLCGSELNPFKYLGKNLTNQNSNYEEIKIRLKSGNTVYHSVQNVLSSNVLFEIVKIGISITVNFACFFVWV
jgi:hypothetical protein